MLDSVAEELTVRQPREGIVEGLMGEPVLELLAFTRIPSVEHEAADARIVDERRDRRLRVAPVAVLMAHLDGQFHRRSRTGRCPHEGIVHAPRVAGWNDRLEEMADERFGFVPEHVPDRWGLVLDHSSRVDHGHDVGRVLHKRTEPLLTLAQGNRTAAEAPRETQVLERRKDLVRHHEDDEDEYSPRQERTELADRRLAV